MAVNDYTKILEEYVLPKLSEYSKIVDDLLQKRVYVSVGSPDEEERNRQRQINKEMSSKLIGSSLEALVILEGNKEKFESCIDLALSRNSHERRQGSYAVITSINVDSFCSDIKSLAYLLEQKEMEDYLKQQIGTFDKAIKEAGLEVREVEADKLSKKR